MTDDDLLESIRSQFADVRLGAPLDEVLARGRELRRNGRWLPAMGAGAGTFATVAALTFATAGGGQAPMLHASLTAWAVKSGPDRTVSLTIRNQRESGPDRERLSAALRAAAVLAEVRTRLPVQCRAGSPVIQRIVTFRPGASRKSGVYRIRVRKIPSGTRIAVVVPAPRMVIRSAAGRTVIWLRPGQPRQVIAKGRVTIINGRLARPGQQVPPGAIAVPPMRELPPSVIRIVPPGELARSREVRRPLARPGHGPFGVQVLAPRVIVLAPGGRCLPILRPSPKRPAGHGGA